MHLPLTALEPADTASSLAAAIHALPTATSRIRVVDDDALPILLASLAAGDHRTVTALLRRTGDGGGTAAWTAGPAPSSLAGAALLARHHAWTGDLGVSRTLWNKFIDVAADAVRTPPHGQQDARQVIIAMGGCSGLERVAPDVGDAQAAAAFRAAARELGTRLPDRLSPTDLTLAAALGLELPGRAGTAAGTPGPAQNSAAVMDSAPATDVAAFTPDEAAMTVLRFTAGRLGLEPDAPRHRLRLRPVLGSLSVRDIPIGDGTVHLDIQQGDAGEWHVQLEQDSGAIPVTAVLEPYLPGPGSVMALVDDRPADLVPRPVPGGVVLPVQLVLDAPRRLTIKVQQPIRTEGRPPK